MDALAFAGILAAGVGFAFVLTRLSTGMLIALIPARD